MSFQLEEDVTLTGAEEREHQLEMAAELLEQGGKNAVIHADVGLGKTETVLMEMAARNNEKPEDYSAMVVVPNERLISQWTDRINEYDIEFDVRVNQPKKDRNISDIKRSIPNGERRERLEEHFEGEGFRDKKKQDVQNADVFITTYQLLSSDIRNDRLADLNLEFDEVIVDEATHLLSELTEGNTENGENYIPGYRLDRRFEDFYDGLTGARMIGLTALPGSKLEHLSDKMDASVISPDQEKAQEYMSHVQKVDNWFEDEDIEAMSNAMDLGVSTRAKRFQNAVWEEYRARPDSSKAYRFIGDEAEEVDKAARSLMSAKQEKAKVSEAVMFPDLEEGITKTPKGEFMEGMSRNLQFMDEQYLVFVSQRSTAENLSNLLEGEVGTVKGDNSSSANQERINRFEEGEIDGLVMTYGAGGEGLDLNAADRVFHMSTYAPDVHMQSATGRAKRDDGVIEHNLAYSFEPEAESDHYEFRGMEPRYDDNSLEVVRDVIEEEESEAGGQEISWGDVS